nr:hypothetical protein [Tanacetum cinerariifolium]
MYMTIDQQVALDEALVPYASRLRIGKSNFRLKSDISSKESTLQLVYDVLRLTPFFKAFLVTADVPKIYMHELWATATVYHHSIRRNVDFAYLMWEDFVYQVEHKDAKKINEMYYPRNSKAYKEYYAVAIGATPPKTKASIQKTKSSSDTTVTPPTAAAGKRLSTSTKGKQPAKASKAKSLTQTHISQASGSGVDEGTGSIPGVLDVPTEESDEKISWKSSVEEDDDDVDEGSDDQDDDDAQDNDDDQDDKNKDDDEDELYRDVNINLEGRVVQMADVHTTQEFEDSNVTLTLVNPDGQQQSSSVSSQFVTNMLNLTPDAGIDSIFETTSQMDVQFPTTVAPLPLSTPTLTPSTIATISIVPQAPTPPTTALSTLLQDLPNFGSLFGFDHRLKTLEANFYEFVQTNQFTGASDRLRNEAQAENEEFLKNLDENIQKIIKEQVKEQVKVQVTKILPRIEQTMNEQLEAEVLTRSSNSSKTSYAFTADLSEMELKKILIKKIEGNKSIHRSNEQRNLYNALVKAY